MNYRGGAPTGNNAVSSCSSFGSLGWETDNIDFGVQREWGAQLL